MKFGQALSILEGALPEEIAAPYRAHLTMLQDSAPPMSTAVVHQQLVREFGAGWKRNFVEFDDIPTAAASIGQVHQGRWVDGTEVAIKIQYPGAEQALMSDLKQITRLAKTFGGLLPGIDARRARPGAAGPDRRGARLRPGGRGPARHSRTRSPATRSSWSRGRSPTRNGSSSPSGCPRQLTGEDHRGAAARRSATTGASSMPGSCSPARRAAA